MIQAYNAVCLSDILDSDNEVPAVLSTPAHIISNSRSHFLHVFAKEESRSSFPRSNPLGHWDCMHAG